MQQAYLAIKYLKVEIFFFSVIYSELSGRYIDLLLPSKDAREKIPAPDTGLNYQYVKHAFTEKTS